MNNQQKLVVVILIILGLLFFLGVGAGVRFNSSKKGKPSLASENSRPGLVEVIDEWLAPFGPRLTLNRVYCNDHPITQTFQLTQAEPECILTFPPATGNELSRKASLRVLGGAGIPMYFAYGKPDQKPGEPPDPCLDAEPPGLNLIFAELGETPSTECWSEKPPGKPVRIIALKKAATLRLVCEACRARSVDQLTLKFE